VVLHVLLDSVCLRIIVGPRGRETTTQGQGQVTWVKRRLELIIGCPFVLTLLAELKWFFEISCLAQVLELIEHDQAQGLTKWRLADVRANAPVKGRALSKRQRAAVYDIPVPSITRARVFVDF
jgi:hypothetical protein